LQKDVAPADNQGGNMGRHRPDGGSTTSPRLAQQLAEQQQKATAEKATLDAQQQKKFRDFAAQADREATALNKDAEQARQEALEEAKTGAVKAATAIQEATAKAAELRKNIAEAKAAENNAESDALMRELKATEDHMASALGREHDGQQSKLQDRLAKRKARRGALARQECQLKQEQAAETAKLEQSQ